MKEEDLMNELQTMTRKEFMHCLETDALSFGSTLEAKVVKKAPKRSGAFNGSRISDNRWDEVSRVTIPAFAK